MATTDFGVTYQDVLEKLPIDASQISATTEPLSTGDLDAFIKDASSELVSVLNNAGLSADGLGDDTQRQMQVAVEAYAVAEGLDAIGVMSVRSDSYREKWESIYSRHMSSPSSLAESRSRVKSNINTHKPAGLEFTKTGYQW